MLPDDTDRRILRTLQREGRVTNAHLAEAVNLSAAACHRRVQQLEADGVFQDYVALLHARKPGMPSTMFVDPRRRLRDLI